MQRATEEGPQGASSVYSPKHHLAHQNHSMPYPSNGRVSNQNRFGIFNATDKTVQRVDYGKLEATNAAPGKPMTSGGNAAGMFLNFGQGPVPQVMNAPATTTNSGANQRYSSHHAPKPLSKQGNVPSSSYRQQLNSRGNSNNQSAAGGPPMMQASNGYSNMLGPKSGTSKTGFEFT